MKKIKFRAYNTRTKELVLVHDLYWFEENFVHNNGDNDWIIQQWTGYKDENGVDIYEGHKLLYNDKFYTVIWHEAMFVAFPEKENANTYYEFISEINEQCCIVGNIFLDNPNPT